MSGFSRFIGIIFGIIIIASGVYLIKNLEVAFFTTGIVIGIAVILEGLASFAMWNSMRRNEISNPWMLFSAIISIAFGIFMLVNYKAQTTVSVIVLYFIAVWLVVSGITKLVQAVKLKKLAREFPFDIQAGGWIWSLIFGILLILAGIASLINPVLLLISLVLMLAIDLIIVGVATMITAISA